MKEKLSALKVNLRLLLKKVEELKIDQPDYEVNAKLQKIELKVDELNDIISEIEHTPSRKGGTPLSRGESAEG